MAKRTLTGGATGAGAGALNDVYLHCRPWPVIVALGYSKSVMPDGSVTVLPQLYAEAKTAQEGLACRERVPLVPGVGDEAKQYACPVKIEAALHLQGVPITRNRRLAIRFMWQRGCYSQNRCSLALH